MDDTTFLYNNEAQYLLRVLAEARNDIKRNSSNRRNKRNSDEDRIEDLEGTVRLFLEQTINLKHKNNR